MPGCQNIFERLAYPTNGPSSEWASLRYFAFFGTFDTAELAVCDERFTVNRSMTTGAGMGAEGVIVVWVELTVNAFPPESSWHLPVIRKKPKFVSLNCSSVIVLPCPSGSVWLPRRRRLACRIGLELGEVIVATIARNQIRDLAAIRLHRARVALVQVRVPREHEIGPDAGLLAACINLLQHGRARKVIARSGEGG